MRTSAQFDEPSPVRVCSVVFAVPPSGVAKSSQAADAMDTSPCKEDQTLEGAVGGQIEEDPNTHPWHGCVTVRIPTVTRKSTSGLYSAHSQMVEGRTPGVLRDICCPPGNGQPPLRPRPALLPQATWR